MKTVTRWLLALIFPFALLGTANGGDFEAGKQYVALKNPQPTSTSDKIEVVELFWYGCPHCYELEPFVKDWLASKPEDVEFVRMPAILGKGWELLARAYYTAELLNIMDKIHQPLFQAIHVNRQKFRNEADVQALFSNQGVSTGDFKNTFNSFAVAVKINNARQMTRRYAITGVPTLIVNGKYSTSGKLAGGNRNIIDVVNYLVDRERPALPAVAPAEAAAVPAAAAAD
jgi:thiol:disulfide interchange protein DsbA